VGAGYGYTINHQTLELMRAAAVRLWKKGVRVEDIAKSMKLNRSTVFGWIQRYRHHGISALKSKHGAGAPSKLSQNQIIKLIAMLRRPATEYGFDSDLWTGPRVRKLIRKMFDVTLHRNHMARFLRRLGLVRKSAERRALEQNPKAVAYWKKNILPEITRAAEKCKGLVLYGDEALFSLIPYVGKTWTFPGLRPIVRVSGKRGVHVGVTSAVSSKGHLYFQFSQGNFNARTLIRFMKLLHQHFGKRRIFFIIDGAPCHKAKVVGEYVKENCSWLRLDYLPSYSPELNPDEEVWNHIKTRRLNARPLADKKQLYSAVNSSLKSLQKKPDVVKKFFDQ
jgi:transposase